MLSIWSKLQARWVAIRNDEGASLVEYALLVVLIAIVALIAIAFAGEQVSDVFSEIGSELANP